MITAGWRSTTACSSSSSSSQCCCTVVKTPTIKPILLN